MGMKMKERVSVQGEQGEIGFVEAQVSEGDNIVDLTLWTADGGGSTSLRLDVSETLELVRVLAKAARTSLQNT